MTVAESIVKAIDALTLDKQQEALALIRRLGQEQPQPWISPEGIARGTVVDMSLDDFQSLRREMWGNSTEDEAR